MVAPGSMADDHGKQEHAYAPKTPSKAAHGPRIVLEDRFLSMCVALRKKYVPALTCSACCTQARGSVCARVKEPAWLRRPLRVAREPPTPCWAK